MENGVFVLFIFAYMKPVMKQNAARGTVACDGSISDVRCVQKVGLVVEESAQSMASPLLPSVDGASVCCDTGRGSEFREVVFSFNVMSVMDVLQMGRITEFGLLRVFCMKSGAFEEGQGEKEKKTWLASIHTGTRRTKSQKPTHGHLAGRDPSLFGSTTYFSWQKKLACCFI
jgi:hypothetical protein